MFLTNAVLLNEVHEAVTFKNPIQMLRSIRAYRRNKDLYRDVLPHWSKIRTPLDAMCALMLKNVKLKKDLDELEKALLKDLNRTHTDHTMQTGKIDNLCSLAVEETVQPKKFAWRRDGRIRREMTEPLSQGL